MLEGEPGLEVVGVPGVEVGEVGVEVGTVGVLVGTLLPGLDGSNEYVLCILVFDAKHTHMHCE